MASGDVVNTAARLQSAAPTDGILVGEATYRATRHVIDYVEAPAVEAKGKSRPIPVWEVVAARPRYGTDVEQVHRSPLVGRTRELGLLTEGDLLRAADLFAAMGVDFNEAWARLIAAEQGELSQLEAARAFFAEQAATPFLRRCEAVLAASA